MTKALIIATTEVSEISTQVKQLVDGVNESKRAIIVVSDTLATRTVLATIDKILKDSDLNVAFSRSPRQCEYVLRKV